MHRLVGAAPFNVELEILFCDLLPSNPFATLRGAGANTDNFKLILRGWFAISPQDPTCRIPISLCVVPRGCRSAACASTVASCMLSPFVSRADIFGDGQVKELRPRGGVSINYIKSLGPNTRALTHIVHSARAREQQGPHTSDDLGGRVPSTHY